MPSPLDKQRSQSEVRARYDKFAEVYAQTGNGTKAAIAAGYSPKTATVQASQLLRRPRIQALVLARNVKREIHAEETYRNLIDVGRAAMGIMIQALQDPAASRKDKRDAIDCAGRQLERIARVEGLLVAVDPADKAGGVEKHFHLTLQQLCQTFEQHYHINAAKPADAKAPAAVGWKSIVEGGNGHGSGNGNGSTESPAA